MSIYFSTRIIQISKRKIRVFFLSTEKGFINYRDLFLSEMGSLTKKNVNKSLLKICAPFSIPLIHYIGRRAKKKIENAFENLKENLVSYPNDIIELEDRLFRTEDKTPKIEILSELEERVKPYAIGLLIGKYGFKAERRENDISNSINLYYSLKTRGLIENWEYEIGTHHFKLQ